MHKKKLLIIGISVGIVLIGSSLAFALTHTTQRLDDNQNNNGDYSRSLDLPSNTTRVSNVPDTTTSQNESKPRDTSSSAPVAPSQAPQPTQTSQSIPTYQPDTSYLQQRAIDQENSRKAQASLYKTQWDNAIAQLDQQQSNASSSCRASSPMGWSNQYSNCMASAGWGDGAYQQKLTAINSQYQSLCDSVGGC